MRFVSLFIWSKLSHSLMCSKSLSLGQLHVGLDAGWAVRRVEVLFRAEVRRKCGKISEAVVEGSEVRMRREDALVVLQGEDGLHNLEQEEVCHRKISAGDPVVAAELSGELGKKRDGFFNGSILVVWFEEHGHEGHQVVLADALHLDDSASFLSVCSHKGWCPSVSNIHSHSAGLRELEVAVDDVRDVRVLDAQIQLILLAPVGCSEVVAPVFEVNFSVGQNASVDVSAINNSGVPVAENRSCLCHFVIDLVRNKNFFQL